MSAEVVDGYACQRSFALRRVNSGTALPSQLPNLMLYIITTYGLPAICVKLKSFDLDNVVLEPAPKPAFMMNATYDAIKQFMSIYRMPEISQLQKVAELDVLIGTLRPEVQQAYQAYKAESLLLKLTQDERLQEIAEKAHFTMVHLAALKKSSIGVNEHKKRIELIFSEFSDFMVQAVTDEIANTVDLIMRQMLRALLFTEKMTQK